MINFPNSPTDGQLFTSGASSWVWNAASSQWKVAPVGFNPNVQRLSGNAVTTQFTLTSSPVNANYVDVYITGLYQQKDTYTISGNILTFSEAPPTGTDNIELKWGNTLDIGVPSDYSVTASKLQSGAAISNIGYTPVNKAGDTMIGDFVIDGTLQSRANANLPASVSSNAIHTGGYTSPNSGKLIIGDGTGWKYSLAKRSAGVTTDLVSFIDSGVMLIPNQPSFYGWSDIYSPQKNYNSEVIFNTTNTNGINLQNNVGNYFVASTGRFTAPTAGRYYFHGSFSRSLGNATLDIYRNGISVGSRHLSYGSDWQNVAVSVVLQLAASDYVELRFGGTNGTTTSGYRIHFTGYLIG